MDTTTVTTERDRDLARREGFEFAEPVMSLEEMTKLLDNDEERLLVAQGQRDQARRRYREKLTEAQRLFPTASEETLRREVIDTETTAIEATEAALGKASNIASANARSLAAQLETAEPQLSDAEAARAGSLATFVREDCETAPIGRVRDQMRAALQGSDRAAMFCWLRYGRQRIDRRDPVHATDNAPDGQRAKSEVIRMLSAMRERLQDEAKAKAHGKAKDLIVHVSKLNSEADKAKRQRTPTQLFKGDVPWE